MTPFFPVLAKTGLRGSSKVLGLSTYSTVHCRSDGGISEIYTTILYRYIRDMLYAKILNAALD